MGSVEEKIQLSGDSCNTARNGMSISKESDKVPR